MLLGGATFMEAFAAELTGVLCSSMGEVRGGEEGGEGGALARPLELAFEMHVFFWGTVPQIGIPQRQRSCKNKTAVPCRRQVRDKGTVKIAEVVSSCLQIFPEQVRRAPLLVP